MTQHTIRLRLTFLAAVVGLLLGPLTASAPTYYVSTSGNNSNNGLTATTAWRNIQYAANYVQAGDTVQVLGGIYNELVNIPTSGSPRPGISPSKNIQDKPPSSMGRV